MGRIGQKVKKIGAVGMKVGGAIGALGATVGMGMLGQKMGEMSDSASRDNFNREQDAIQARSRETYLAGESRYGAPSEYVRTGQIPGFSNSFDDFDDDLGDFGL